MYHDVAGFQEKGLRKEITEVERAALVRLRQAIEAGDAERTVQAERALMEAARATGAADVWEAWAFLSAETEAAVATAIRRERDEIGHRLEALYADPNSTWDDVLAVVQQTARENVYAFPSVA